MKLLTRAITSKVPGLYGQESKGDETLVYAKFFTPWSDWTWYMTEYDPETGRAFGWVERNDPTQSELGYFMVSEFETVRGPFGLGVERDTSFQPCRLIDIKSYKEKMCGVQL